MLDAIVSIIGIAMQADALAQERQLKREALQETKRVNRKQEQLATSERRDAQGNRLVYIPGLGWRIKPTGMTKKILGAEQSETLASLLFDAPRQRASAERRDTRARAADDIYDTLLSEFKYRSEPSETALADEATRLALAGRRKGLDEASSIIARQLLRTGSSGDLPRVFEQADNLFADTMEEALLRGKAAGRQEARSLRAQDLSADLQELGFLLNAAGDTDQAPIRFTDFNQRSGAQAEGALQFLEQIIGQNQGRYMQAMDSLAESVGKTPDLSGLASSLGNLTSMFGKGMGSGGAKGRLARDDDYVMGSSLMKGAKSVYPNWF